LYAGYKHAREDKHKIITGVSNEKIKRFALYLSDQGVPIWIRYVLVPGYTDDEDDLKMAADFIKKLKTVEKSKFFLITTWEHTNGKNLVRNTCLKE